jgi:hypothetical protein
MRAVEPMPVTSRPAETEIEIHRSPTRRNRTSASTAARSAFNRNPIERSGIESSPLVLISMTAT